MSRWLLRSVGLLVACLVACSNGAAPSDAGPTGAGGLATTGAGRAGAGNQGGTSGAPSGASGANATGGTAGPGASGGAGGLGVAASGGFGLVGGANAAGSTVNGGAGSGAASAGSASGGTGSGGGTASGGGPGAGGVNGGGRGGAAGGAALGGAPSAGAGGSTSGAAGSAGAFGVCTSAPAGGAVSVYVIGDSTASVYTSDLYPRMGWAQPLGDLFSSQCATVKDKALSGRSSKSFFDEGAWTPVRDALKAGDYVLIQFAHNDEKSDDPVRYTDPQTTYKQYLTTYVTDSRAKNAIPILLTPINRNQWSGSTVSNSHGAYPDAMRQLAASLSVPLIDHTALTKSYFERIGQAETAKLFLILAPGEFPNYPSGNTDNTHLQEKGARLIGQLAMWDAYQQKLPLASGLKAVPVAP